MRERATDWRRWLDGLEEGQGCDHCPYAEPVVYVAVKRFTVALCWLCARIATGWTTEQLEMATRPFDDHLDVALEKAAEYEKKQGLKEWLRST